MKLAFRLTFALVALLFAQLAVFAEDVLPDSGTYFIVNADKNLALEPLGATPGQNVFAKPYNKSGMQKWTINRIIDIKTKKPTNRYNIRVAGEVADLNFLPYPVADHTSMLGPEKSVYVLQPLSGAFVIKSVARNGDALFVQEVPESFTDVKFGPSDSTAKFQWVFEAAN